MLRKEATLKLDRNSKEIDECYHRNCDNIARDISFLSLLILYIQTSRSLPDIQNVPIIQLQLNNRNAQYSFWIPPVSYYSFYGIFSS